MRAEVASPVHQVLAYGLRLKGRLENGEAVSLVSEQAVLKGMLQDPQGQRWPEFVGDPAPLDAGPGAVDRFLGGRYALVCWLDEVFTIDTRPHNERWANDWNEHSLEFALYRTRDRAWMFWDQARRAESREGADALEMFYLAAMLGFRGDFRNRPDRLEVWRVSVEERLRQGQGEAWPAPRERRAATDVPPLGGRDAFRKVALACCVLLGLLIPLATFLLFRALG